MTATVRTTCPYCGVGCGVLATPGKNGGVAIAGDPDHPANFGRLCVKGSALGETLGLEGRLLHPMVRSRFGEAPRQISWDDALDRVAGGFLRIIEKHGPEAVAFYVSGQLLTEDYYVANKLMKGWIGTANIDTNSRLCMSSAVAGYQRAFGEDVVPCDYEDLECADLIVLVGSNTAWCHPILFQRITRERERREKAGEIPLRIVVIDPRRTATCEIAELHLPLRPGSDVMLFNGLLQWLQCNGNVDRRFVTDHTHGIDEALLASNEAADLRFVALSCGIDEAMLQAFYELFAATKKTITAFSMGVNQSSAGTDKVNAIINCHLLSGRIGQPGMGPFSLTGQPNAMGGREVGGLANLLAAHRSLASAEDRAEVQTFWNSPHIASKQGLKAVDMFDAIHEGRIKAVWIAATNPVVSLPDADKIKAALERCELVVVSDCIADTDTSAYAHLLLPAAGWSEKDGTVTNSERRISRSRAFLPAAGEARDDWRIFCDVAKRMRFDAGFEFNSAAEVFDEHARLSAYCNDGRRAFDIGGVVGLDSAAFQSLEPFQWPAPSGREQERAAVTPRPFADGHFFHPDGRARFVATTASMPVNPPNAEFPLVLNTGRVRDHWHTMTRTGRSARLAAHVAEPFVQVHADDALATGVAAGSLARLRTRWGDMVARVQLGGVRRGEIFAPIHWNDQFASHARVGALVNPVVDPVSGEPEFKHTPARIEPYAACVFGFLLRRDAINPFTDARVSHGVELDTVTWTRVPGLGCNRYEFALTETPHDLPAFARALTGESSEDDWIDYQDTSGGVLRSARLENDRLEACIFISETPKLAGRDWLARLFARVILEDADRVALLAGRRPAGGVDLGPIVCSCFGVPRGAIEQTIRSHKLRKPAEVTACLKAGGNCGSCLPEISSLIAECQPGVTA